MSLLTDLSTGLLTFTQLEQRSSADTKVGFVCSLLDDQFVYNCLCNCKYLPCNLDIFFKF